MTVFEPGDFAIGVDWYGDEVHITHFEVSEELRGNHFGSAVLETLKRVYYYEGADKLVVRMGGGEAAAKFLEANDFSVTNIRESEVEDAEDLHPEHIVRTLVEAEYVYDRDS